MDRVEYQIRDTLEEIHETLKDMLCVMDDAPFMANVLTVIQMTHGTSTHITDEEIRDAIGVVRHIMKEVDRNEEDPTNP